MQPTIQFIHVFFKRKLYKPYYRINGTDKTFMKESRKMVQYLDATFPEVGKDKISKAVHCGEPFIVRGDTNTVEFIHIAPSEKNRQIENIPTANEALRSVKRDRRKQQGNNLSNLTWKGLRNV